MIGRASLEAAVLSAAVLALIPGCFADYKYRSEFAPGFVQSHRRVSILGVFKDGRMDFESWDALAPALSAAFGARKCPAGYSEDFVAGHATLASAVDDVARADGLGDGLLTELSPAALGDLVVVFTIAGRVEKAHVSTTNAPLPSGGMGGGGGGAGSLGTGIPMPQRGRQDTSNTATLNLSATMFSTAQRASVGVIELDYTGENANDAIAKFAAKVYAAIPGSTCEGWNWAAPIDEHRVRDLLEH